jgi:hypothetical protein
VSEKHPDESDLEKLKRVWIANPKLSVGTEMGCVEELNFLAEVKEFIHRLQSRMAARLGRTSDRAIVETHMHFLLPQHLETLKHAGVHDVASLQKFEEIMIATYEKQANSDTAMTLTEQYIREAQ